jgi:transposase
MERIAMSQEERDWLEWLKRARDGAMTQREAAEKMAVSERWVRKLLRRMKKDGDVVVVHGLRGLASNRQISEKVRQQAVQWLQQPEWHDFGPTFASEQLCKRHQIEVSKETVRGWMIGAGVWKAHSRKVGEVHCWRRRRSGYGDLVQWDTSDHDWLEGRGEPVRYLVRMIDDAASRSWGRFVKHDGTRENMGVLWEYAERNGLMAEVYTDRASMFAVAPRAGETEEQRRQADRVTQIGRALRELGIGWIAAYSPQAKGRVERSFGTDQDRLVKELRLAKVTTMQAANEFLEREYWPEWNQRFARPVEGITNGHRPLTGEVDLAAILSHVEQRVITNDYTFPFAGRRYRIGREAVRAGMKRQTLRVELRLDGAVKARYEGRYVEISECSDSDRRPIQPVPSVKVVRKDHNAGGKSRWMEGFWDLPAPELWRAIRDSNATS